MQVWCVGNVSGLQMQLNQSVTGDVLHVLVDDLVPEILYSVQVVAVTSAGAGEPSEPVFILISECLPLTAASVVQGDIYWMLQIKEEKIPIQLQIMFIELQNTHK